MTRAEAIHFAECLKHNWTIDFNDMEDFCDMAISALQVEQNYVHIETYRDLYDKYIELKHKLAEQDIITCKECSNRGSEFGCPIDEHWHISDYDFCSWANKDESHISAEPIKVITDDTIEVRYTDFENIKRIILTNGDIFCKMFYEDARQNDDSDYDSLVPDEYKTEPSDLISRADAVEAVQDVDTRETVSVSEAVKAINALPSADAVSREEYEDIIKDYRKQYENMNNEIADLEAKLSADTEQVTSKLKNPCDSLLTEDSAECKEQKSKLEHDREWIIGCIKHDGFIKTDRFDKANQIILDALANRPSGEWVNVNTTNPPRFYHMGECSICGAHGQITDNYCPNCGARMENK